VREFIKEVLSYIEAEFPNTFYHSGSNDTVLLRKWHSMGITPQHISHALSEEPPEGRFTLQDIDSTVPKYYTRFLSQEAEDARNTLEKETIPHERLRKLSKVVKLTLIELGAHDSSIPEQISRLALEESNLLKLERALSKLEEHFYAILLKRSSHTKECLKSAEKALRQYGNYWEPEIVKMTKTALVKKCLKEKHRIPEFSVL